MTSNYVSIGAHRRKLSIDKTLLGMGMKPTVIVTLADREIDAPEGAIVINWQQGTFTFNGISTKPLRRRRPNRSPRFKLMACVLSCAGDYLSLVDMFEATWGDDEDGGPLRLQEYWLITKQQYKFYHPEAKRFVRIAEWLGLDTKPVLSQGPYRGIRILWGKAKKYGYKERAVKPVRRTASGIEVTQTA